VISACTSSPFDNAAGFLSLPPESAANESVPADSQADVFLSLLGRLLGSENPTAFSLADSPTQPARITSTTPEGEREESETEPMRGKREKTESVDHAAVPLWSTTPIEQRPVLEWALPLPVCVNPNPSVSVEVAVTETANAGTFSQTWTSDSAQRPASLDAPAAAPEKQRQSVQPDLASGMNLSSAADVDRLELTGPVLEWTLPLPVCVNPNPPVSIEVAATETANAGTFSQTWTSDSTQRPASPDAPAAAPQEQRQSVQPDLAFGMRLTPAAEVDRVEWTARPELTSNPGVAAQPALREAGKPAMAPSEQSAQEMPEPVPSDRKVTESEAQRRNEPAMPALRMRSGATSAEHTDKDSPAPEHRDSGKPSKEPRKATPPAAAPATATPIRYFAATEPAAPMPSSVPPKTATGEQAPRSPSVPTQRIELPQNAPPSAAPAQAREVTLRLTPAQSDPVDVRVLERGGRVEVSVRTPDAELTSSLRRDLGELVEKLEHKGFRAEAWTPDATGKSISLQERNTAGGDAFSQQSKQEHAQQQSSGGREQRGQGRRPQWLEELDESFSRGRNEGEQEKRQ
jgi:hypothetical protein